MLHYEHPFDPIVDADSRVLILGSFPSFDSFKQHFYYANRQNAFWKILSQLYDAPLETIEQKRALLHVKRIALWDIVGACRRDSSLDARLKAIEVNDIAGLLQAYPNIERVGCNGKKAYELFLRHNKDAAIEVVSLPSTSAANARMKFEQKFEAYRDFLAL